MALLHVFLPMEVDDLADFLGFVPDGGKRARCQVKRNEVVGFAHAREAGQKAQISVDPVYFLVGLAGLIQVAQGKGLEKLEVLGTQTVVDLEKPETIGIPSEAAQQLGRMLARGKGARRDLLRIDSEGFEILGFDEPERVLVAGNSLRVEGRYCPLHPEIIMKSGTVSIHKWTPSRLLKNAHLRRCPRPASLRRTGSTPHSSGLRAPCIWAFFSNLHDGF